MSPKKITVNGTDAVQLPLTIRTNSFHWARSAIGKWPSSDVFSWLMAILEGQEVEATVFSLSNICGHTSEKQLREAFTKLNPDYTFWVGEPQLEAVIERFGDGSLGFDMSGLYCQQTPEEIQALIRGE